ARLPSVRVTRSVGVPPWSGAPISFASSGGLGGAPAAAALRARPRTGHRRAADLAPVLRSDADRAEPDLPVLHPATDAVGAARTRERDPPVQPRASLPPVDREVTRDGAAVVARPLAAERRPVRGVTAPRGENGATACECKKSGDSAAQS